MGYSGWRFTCDRCTLERWHGAVETRLNELRDSFDPDMMSDELDRDTRDMFYYLHGAAAALAVILGDADNPTPEEFVEEVLSH